MLRFSRKQYDAQPGGVSEEGVRWTRERRMIELLFQFRVCP